MNDEIPFDHADSCFIASLANEAMKHGSQDDVLFHYIFFERQRLLTGHKSFGEWRSFCGSKTPLREEQLRASDYILSEAETHADPEIKKVLFFCQSYIRSVDFGLSLAVMKWMLRDSSLNSVGFVLRDAIKEFK